MKKEILLKILCVFLLLNGWFLHAQKNIISKRDSLLVLIEKSIESNDAITAQELVGKARNLKDFNDDLFSIKLNYYQANIFVLEEKDEKALKILLDGHSKIEYLDDIKFHVKYVKAIGRIFSRAKNYNKSLKYFKEGIDYSLKYNDSISISTLYLNAGSVFQNIKQMDSAEMYYEKVLQYHPRNLKEDETLATVYINLIGIAVAKGDFDLAEEYGKKSIELHEIRKDTIKLAGAVANMGSLNMYTGDLKASEEYYLKTLDLLDGNTDLKSREVTVTTLDNLSQVYYLLGDYKTGYDYLFESVDIAHKLTVENAAKKITEIEAKFNLEQKENENKLEKEKREKAELLLYIFGGTIVVLLVLIWLFKYNSSLKREKLDLVFKQAKIEQVRKLEKIQSDAQIKILNATIDGKEAERRHIAEILHDNVSTLLSSANMHLYAAKTALKKNTPEEVTKIESIINEASDKIRDLSHKLISSVLLKFGLASAVEDLCEKYSNSKLVFNSDSRNIKRYDQSFEIKIHNIIEELVNNILKHSNASMATIDLIQVGKNLQIQVNDNGDGFDVEEVVHQDGLGLSQIQARIKMMKGNFEIKSYKDTGTQVSIDVPVSEL